MMVFCNNNYFVIHDEFEMMWPGYMMSVNQRAPSFRHRQASIRMEIWATDVHDFVVALLIDTPCYS